MIIYSSAQLDEIPQRIISLVPSQTELLFYLELDDQVIGITKFCVHPPAWKKSKIIIGGTKNINMQKVHACNPDLVIANKEENIKEQVEVLAEKYTVWLTDVTNIFTALQMITDLGIITGKQARSNEIVIQIKKRFNNINLPSKKIKTFYLIWRHPYMTIASDTFIHDMLASCGLENMAAAKRRYPEVSLDEIKTSDCELLLLSSEPYPFKQRHVDELKGLLPGIKIMLVNGEMFSWYGSRMLYAPDYFKTILEQLYKP